MITRITPHIIKHAFFATTTAVAYASFKQCQDNYLRYKLKYWWSRCDKPDYPLCPDGVAINQLFQDMGWKNPIYYHFDAALVSLGYADHIGFANSYTFIANEYPAAYVIINSSYKGDTYDLDPKLYKEIAQDAFHLVNNDFLNRNTLKAFSLYFSVYVSSLLIKKTNLHHLWSKPLNVDAFNKLPKSYQLGLNLIGFPLTYIGLSLYGYTKLITSVAEIATLPLVHYQNKRTELAIAEAVNAYTEKYHNRYRLFNSKINNEQDKTMQSANILEENQRGLSK